MADATTPAVDVATNGHQAHEAELSPQQNGTNKSVSLFPPRIITSSSTENVHHQTSSHPAPPPKGKSLNNSISAMSIPDVAEARRPVSSTRGAAVPPSPSDISAAMHSKSYTSTPAHASTHANNHKTATTAGARTVVQRDNTTSSPRSNVSETLKKIAATSKNLKNPAAMRMALLDLKTVIQPESSSTRRTTTRRTFTNTATANPTNTRRANPSQSPTRAAAAAGTPSEDTASAGSGARRPALHVDCVPLRTTAAADHNGSPKSPSTMLRSTGNPTKHGSPARNSPAQRSFIPSRRMVDLTQEDARELSLSSAGFQRILTKRSRQPKKVLNVSHTKYAVVRRVAAVSGFSVQETEEEFLQYQFNMAWSDTVLPLTQLTRLQNWQRTNHFPAMYLICRKGHLSSTLGVMRKRLPEEFEFFPRTWSMRTERTTFSRVVQAINQRKLTRYFIMKPNSGCQGRGIIVTRDPMNALENADNYIVQEYVHRPLLLEGRKFDLRIYVLLMNIRQPSIFMFNDGLVRLCAESYEPPTDDNTKNSCKHLTNYAVNKRSPEFVFNTDAEHGDVGNKRNFRFLNGWLLAEGHNVDDFWESIGHIIVKTILAAQPQISSVYNSCFPSFNEGYSCFEVLGFDILVDDHMKPWLMEVNHTPSLATDTPLDNDIKSKLVEETWDIVDCKSTDLMKERDREREEFTKHNLPPWASNHPLYGTVKSRGADGAEVSSPTTTEDGVTKPSFTLVTPGRHRDDLEQLEERRALEDTKLKNYARIYPPGDYATQEMFDRVLKVAQEECPAEFKGRASNALRRTATPRSMASSARSRPRPARTPPPAPSSPITASPTTAASSAAEVKANATRFNTNNHGAAYASILGSNVLHAKAPANNNNKTSASASATTTPAAAHPEHHKPVLAISTTTADGVATNPSSPITPGGTPTSFPTKNEKLEPTEEELQWLQQLQQQLDKAASEDPEPVSCSDFPE